jgi:hypothetical protein
MDTTDARSPFSSNYNLKECTWSLETHHLGSFHSQKRSPMHIWAHTWYLQAAASLPTRWLSIIQPILRQCSHPNASFRTNLKAITPWIWWWASSRAQVQNSLIWIHPMELSRLIRFFPVLKIIFLSNYGIINYSWTTSSQSKRSVTFTTVNCV